MVAATVQLQSLSKLWTQLLWSDFRSKPLYRKLALSFSKSVFSKSSIDFLRKHRSATVISILSQVKAKLNKKVYACSMTKDKNVPLT